VSERPLEGVTVVLGGIGDDIHVVALKILERTLTDAGATVHQLGVMTPPAEFQRTADDVSADAIWISSSNGHAEHWCVQLAEALEQSGNRKVLLYIGGNLAVGAREWPDVEQRFRGIGFHRVYAPGASPAGAVEDLAGDVAAREDDDR
jgi:methylaspartate mutase sigma subunit